MAPELIRLGSADADRLRELDQRCFAPGIAYTRAEMAALLRAGERGFHRGIERQGQLAAFILTLPRRQRGHVITVDVAPEWRREGLGLALMTAAEAHYRAEGARGMRLEVAVNNQPALRFYSRQGYRIQRTLPGYYSDDLDGLELLKDFAAAA